MGYGVIELTMRKEEAKIAMMTKENATQVFIQYHVMKVYFKGCFCYYYFQVVADKVLR